MEKASPYGDVLMGGGRVNVLFEGSEYIFCLLIMARSSIGI